MKESLVFLMFALISYGIARALVSLSKVNCIESGEAMGRIDKVLDTEDGCIFFEVSFNAKLKEYKKCYSISYYSTNGKYRAGDVARIKYTISKSNYVSVSIIDDELISCEVAYLKGIRNLKIVGCVLLALSIFCAVKTIIIT